MLLREVRDDQVQPEENRQAAQAEANVGKRPLDTRGRLLDVSGDGGEPNAERLSERRARAVRDLLIQHGVAAERLEVTAEGVTRPIAPNVTQAGRALNRRVDFEIVRTTPQPPASPRPVFVQPPRGQPGCPGSQSPPAPLPPPAGGCPRAARSRSVRSHAPLSGTALTKGSTSRWNA